MSYGKLFIVMSINLIIMFFLTYATLDTLQHFHISLSRIYMALLMVSPMAVVMMVFMGNMFKNKRINAAIIGGAVAVFLISFYLIQTQGLINDSRFLKAMIPHHSGAILMCEEAQISDPDVKGLCDQIIESQKQEIAEMKALLNR